MHGGIPESLLALWLTEQAPSYGVLVHVARSASRLDRVAAAARAFAQDRVEVLTLPPWDALPYDRAGPSAGVTGRRVAALTRLATPPDDAGRPRLVLTCARALLQRVQPPSAWAGQALTLRAGDAIDPRALRQQLAERGYRRLDDRVDEAGEVALRGQVLDIFPADAAQPVRIQHAGGRIIELHRFDAATQRTTEPVDRIDLGPASEFPSDADAVTAAIAAMEDPDLDTPDTVRPVLPDRLVPVFDYLRGAAVVLDPEAEQRWTDARDAIEDAYAAASKAGRTGPAAGHAMLPRPDRLFLACDAVTAALAEHETIRIGGPDGIAIPGAPLDTRPGASLAAQIKALNGHRAIVVAAPQPERVANALKRLKIEARVAADWTDAARGPVACLALDSPDGFVRDGLALLPAPQLAKGVAATLAGADEAPRIGDLVVHMAHGVARLRGLVQVGEGERLALEFADGADLLVPPEDLSELWRYGSGDGRIALDRLGGESWTRKRAEVEAEVTEAARHLAAQAAARAARSGPAIRPPRAATDRLARRFPFPLSPDQRAAIAAVLADLEGPRPMDRLVCGDVGFGKTEVALRAAAAAALAGWQVAVIAPTTVLARQHLDNFRRRFAGTGVRVEGLFHNTATEARAVHRAVASGEAGILVGTHAVAGKEVRFARLGLVVVDEEQRFGEALKARLAALRGAAGGTGGAETPHLLAMTATPIPRTMQSALAGLRECSVIATPPVRRQPTRTFVLPWDPVTARDALLRERARGGQSFVVCPRIADLARWEARLREAEPELEIVQAHGRMKPEALDAAVVGFAEGRGDVLLATNIIEAGLDIPRANLILVTDADRFGLAQLHQLRGRVGRAARRGSAYLLTEPGRALAAPTMRRLRTMQALEGLGAGAQVALADLDLRGAGDLFGDRQAGHLRAIGTELYQHLLARAVAETRGEPPAPPPAAVTAELDGRFPEEWVPEDDLRIALYRRLARIAGLAALDEFAAELGDRFGPLPPPAQRLIDLARLRCLGAINGLGRIDAGPQALALLPHDPMALPLLAERLGGIVRGERLVVPLAVPDAAERAARVAALLEAAEDGVAG